jgi:curved DNA-binding protein CbpA
LPEHELKKVIYALVITRHLDLGSGALPIGVDTQSIAPPTEAASARQSLPPEVRSKPAPARGPSLPPENRAPAMSPELQAFRQEVRDRSERIGSQNYYQILGIPRDAPTATIQGAFFQLAKQWHPDRLGADVADLRELAMRVFSRMSEAHQVLTNEEQRTEYERLMREGGAAPDEQEMVQKVLRAATAFQKAEVLVRRGNLEEAEKHAQLAVENDPDQPEYAALYADVLSQKPERTQSGNFTDVIKMVNDARRAQPDNLKVRLYRARVLKRSGDADAAHREFRSIVEQDSHNVEAAREVRLHEMRRGKRSTDPRKLGADGRQTGRQTGPKGTGKGKGSPEAAGLFGKLFKR